MGKRANLIRPSELARFWGVHPKTLYLWVKGGKLEAVRTPGGQFRVGREAVLVLAREHDLPVPPFVGASKPQVALLGPGAALLEGIRRRLRSEGLEVRRYDDPYEGLVAAVQAPPAAVVLVGGDGFDPFRAARSLRKTAKRMRIVIAGAHDLAPRARRFGADVCLDGSSDEVAKVLLGLLADGVRKERVRAHAG